MCAGFKDLTKLKQNKDLDALRERADFKKLIAELEAKQNETNAKDPAEKKQ